MSHVTAGQPKWLTLAKLVPGVVFYSICGRSIDALLVGALLLFRSRFQISETVGMTMSEACWKCLRWTFIAYSLLLAVQLALAAHRTETTPWSGPGKVLLFSSRTTHARLFPKKHSFSYSYLVVGVPVGWEGVAGGMVSSFRRQSLPRPAALLSLNAPSTRGWYHVDPADYLERGNGHLGLRGKLDAYLKSQGADPTAYPHAYLITAARFLGYHFNPVSFWYLYSADMSLAAIILEVNNTFDERRMYFLTPAEPDTAGEIQDEVSTLASKPGTKSDSNFSVFTQSWPKDFHVSPFNSRKGSYSFLGRDPLKALSEGQTPIDNTITLKSSKGHGKIVARLLSEGRPVDPSSINIWRKFAFLLSWWWVGFVTFPRIVKEAGRLFFLRGLHVWYRPEPLKESIGRNATPAEQQLEAVFRQYLRSLVGRSKSAISVKYIASGLSEGARELMLSPSAQNGTAVAAEELEFKVLTPAFYTRFVGYAHDLEALFSELAESCTVWVSRPDLLPRLLFKEPTPPLEVASYADYVCFRAIRCLRRRPERIERPLTSSARPTNPAAPTTTAVDIRDFRNSAMDAFVLGQHDGTLRRRYRSLVLKIFLADRVAVGSLGLLEAGCFVFRVWLAWVVSGAMRGFIASSMGHIWAAE